MARYIDADALMAQMRRQYIFEKTDFDKRMLYVEKSVIENAPTADVVEVVHGEWERILYSFAGGYRCSCCGCKSLERHWKYCPECGAVMDGKKVE